MVTQQPRPRVVDLIDYYMGFYVCYTVYHSLKMTRGSIPEGRLSVHVICIQSMNGLVGLLSILLLFRVRLVCLIVVSFVQSKSSTICLQICLFSDTSLSRNTNLPSTCLHINTCFPVQFYTTI